MQRKEDPDTLSGFYRQKVEHTGRIYHVLALPRDAQGRKLKKNAFAKRGGNRAAYYRVMRPASGFSSTDYDAESKSYASCTYLQSQWQELWQDSLCMATRTLDTGVLFVKTELSMSTVPLLGEQVAMLDFALCSLVLLRSWL